MAKERLDLALEGSGQALWDLDVATGTVFLSETLERACSASRRAAEVQTP